MKWPFGLQQEPALWIPDLAQFEQRWRHDHYALAVMPLGVYDQLVAGRLPMQRIAGDTDR